MMIKRGEIWLADLNPTRGSEQAGKRPVLVLQNEVLMKYTATVIAIPLTTNLRRADLPMCLRIAQGEGGLDCDSMALCHQVRVLDKKRLEKRLGAVGAEVLANIESRILFTFGII